MAQSGYTPIILFNSGVTGHVPTTGNLTLGELAINYTDGIIFYNNGGTIKQFTPSVLAATSGTINGVVIGGTTPAAGTFTTVTSTGLITPSTTIGIKGTTAGDNAQAGSVGEYVSNTASGVSIPGTTTPTNIVSISLTAGDWDVQGYGELDSFGIAVNNVLFGISTTSASFGSIGTYVKYYPSSTTQITVGFPTPTVRINITTTTTVYLVGQVTYGSAGPTATGSIRARRVR